MPQNVRIPSYRRHKASGQAVVVLGGKSFYLGKWDSPESHAAYERVVAEWLANGRRLLENHQAPDGRAHQPSLSRPAAQVSSPRLTVGELILAFWNHGEQHYRHADGTPTGELDNFKDALRPLRKLYGPTAAADFGPLALRAVRAEMVRAGLCRQTINARVNRIRRVFRWAASLELVPAAVAEALA